MPLPVLLEPRHLFHSTRHSISFFFPFSFSSGDAATEDDDSVLKGITDYIN